MKDSHARAILRNLRETEQLLASLTAALETVDTELEFRDLSASIQEAELARADLLLEICVDADPGC